MSETSAQQQRYDSSCPLRDATGKLIGRGDHVVGVCGNDLGTVTGIAMLDDTPHVRSERGIAGTYATLPGEVVVTS